MRTLINLPFQLLGIAITLAIHILPALWVLTKWLLGIKPRLPSTIPFVLDGDTLGFEDGTRMRLYGIDAPELSQPGGHLAKAHLEELMATAHGIEAKHTDPYGRVVGIVKDENGTDLNALMVQHGFARAYTKYAKTYATLEKEAQATHAGLWPYGHLDIHPETWRNTQKGLT